MGITSILAGGKGTVCSIFERFGAVHIDFDILAREALDIGTESYQQTVAAFGSKILRSDGTIDRPSLAQIVFGRPEKLQILNGIIHPYTLRRAEQIIDRHRSLADERLVFALNIPLLFEAGLCDSVDIVIVVDTPRKVAIRRAMRRDGLSARDVLRRLSHQIPVEEKKKHADYIIDNGSSLFHTYRQVRGIWRDIQRQIN